MEKLWNLFESLPSVSSFINALVLILIALIALIILISIIYTQIKVRIFKKNAGAVKVKVKEVKRKESYDKTLRGYDVTFEFEHNGKLKEETIFSSKNFKINSIRDGLYLEGKKKHLLSVEGEGFYVDKGAGFFGITFALYLIFLIVGVLLNVSTRIIIDSTLLYLLLLFSGLTIRHFILNKNKKKRKEIKKKDAIFYNKAHYDEYSTVDSNLVRYIPKYKKPKKRKNDKGSILLRCIFIGLGGMSTLIGIFMLINVLKIVVIYDNTIAEISDIYTYKTTVDSETVECIGVIYTYEVNDNEYTLNYKTGTSKEMYFKKLGDKEKIYYDSDNPNNSIPKKSIPSSLLPIIIGPLFLYIGIQNIIEENKKKRLYNMYVKLSEES